ncbi:MAG: hypothetical protein ACYTF1_00500 [Planctomycetota bacterium]|jgi:hypothetical protein
MPERAPDPFGRTSTGKTNLCTSAHHFTVEEKRAIFKSMVVGELEAGFLRYSKRQALLRYAAGLNIPEFEASLLMAEAQYRADDIEPIGFKPDKISDRPEVLSIPQRLRMALLAAIFIDLVLIWWIM